MRTFHPMGANQSASTMATPSYDSDATLTDASQSDNEFEARLLRRSREFVLSWML